MFAASVQTYGGPRERGVWSWRRARVLHSFYSPSGCATAEKTTNEHRHLVDRFQARARMLVRYPGLTLVSVFGMAVGIAVAAAAFTIVHAFSTPSCRSSEGDRIVAHRRTGTCRTNNREPRSHARLRSVARALQFGGGHRRVRTVGRTLIAAGAQPETVRVAEMSASGFRVARVAPLLGRYLLARGRAPGRARRRGDRRRRVAAALRGDPTSSASTFSSGATALRDRRRHARGLRVPGQP